MRMLVLARRLAAALGLLILASHTALGQSPELLEAHNQAQALAQQGRYADAIPYAENAYELGLVEFGPDHKSAATLIDLLAQLHRDLGDYPKAELLTGRLWRSERGS